MAYTDEYQNTRNKLERFYQPIEMSGGYMFDHVKTLKRIDLYFYSKFESGQYDSQNQRKYFYNIVRPACDVAIKFIDLDTKDIVLYPTRTDDEFKVWVMQRELKLWLKENKFGELLNEIEEDYTHYGHIVIKKCPDKKWRRVNVQNLRMDASASWLKESDCVYEVLSMSAQDIRDMDWGKEAEEYLNVKVDTTNFVVYECYEQNREEGKKWKRSFRTDFLNYKTKQGGYIQTPESQINDESEYLPGCTLYEDTVDELPYREKKWANVPGRWLGMGVVEYLFDNQIRQNELANIKAKGLQFTALHLYQTADEMIGRNVLTDMENGEVIKTPTGITPVSTEERNLSAYAQEEARWEQNAERKTFSFDISRGENLPSGTPLGVAKLSAAMVESFYSLKRENLGLFVKDLLMEDVLPTFAKERSKEHTLRFFSSDKEIEKLRQAIVEHQMRKSIMDYAVKSGTIPSVMAITLEKVRLENGLKAKKDIDLLIPRSFYDDVEYSMDITVTGEEIDVAAKLQTLQTALQSIAANPNIMAIPALRTIFFKALGFAGFSPVELDLIEQQSDQMQQNMPTAQPAAAPAQPVQPVAA